MPHDELANGRWQTMTLMAQLGNIGSDVDRAIRWRERGNLEHTEKAISRSLELLDLTISDNRWKLRRRELTRAREVVCDFLVGENRYQSSAENLSNYFLQFATATRRSQL